MVTTAQQLLHRASYGGRVAPHLVVGWRVDGGYMLEIKFAFED